MNLKTALLAVTAAAALIGAAIVSVPITSHNVDLTQHTSRSRQ